MKLRELAEDSGRRPPSTSEFVDAVITCRELLHENWLERGAEELDRLLEGVVAKTAAQGSSSGD
jgi:hypothetical protein